MIIGRHTRQLRVGYTGPVTGAGGRRIREMVIVLIRTKLHPKADRAAYDALNEQMFGLVQTMPGFIAAHGYSSGDGDEIGMIRFESLEALRAWREHPDHLVAQQRGKTEFYMSYTIEVCEVVRRYEHAHRTPAHSSSAMRRV